MQRFEQSETYFDNYTFISSEQTAVAFTDLTRQSGSPKEGLSKQARG